MNLPVPAYDIRTRIPWCPRQPSTAADPEIRPADPVMCRHANPAAYTGEVANWRIVCFWPATIRFPKIRCLSACSTRINGGSLPDRVPGRCCGLPRRCLLSCLLHLEWASSRAHWRPRTGNESKTRGGIAMTWRQLASCHRHTQGPFSSSGMQCNWRDNV